MPSKTPPNNRVIDLNATQDESADEDEKAYREEEAKIRAEELKKEIDEQNKFDCLCDGIKSAMSLVDSAFTELLELKDELLTHDLPPSLLVALTLSTGKMFRSITDLRTPIQELTRLVSVYSVPWEQKSEQLKKLHTDYECKKRQLNIAIRKLQLIDSQARRMERERIVNNWEKVFSKMTSANTIGRRWKFMIEAFKRKCQDGTFYHEASPGFDDDSESSSDESEHMVEDDVAKNKRRFMMSVITASPPRDDVDSQAGESDIGTDAEGIPSEISESFQGNPEEMSPDLPKKRRGVSFGPPGVNEEVTVFKGVQMAPPMEDKAVWTQEPEFSTKLVVRVFCPTGLSDELSKNISCNFKIGKQSRTTNSFNSTEDIEGEITESKTKSIGFSNELITSKGGSRKASLKTQTGILKPQKEDNGNKPVVVDREKYHEIFLDFNIEDENINISLLQGSKVFGMGILPVGLIENLPTRVKKNNNDTETETTSSQTIPEETEDNKESVDFGEEAKFDIDMKQRELSVIPLNIMKLSPDAVSVEDATLPVLCYWLKVEIACVTDAANQTYPLVDVIHEETGVDMTTITKEELVTILSREYHDACLSAMSFESESSKKSGFLPVEDFESLKDTHDREMRQIHEEYEMKMQELLSDIEQMQQAQHMKKNINWQSDIQGAGDGLVSGFTQSQAQPRPPSDDKLNYDETKYNREKPIRFKYPALPDWGAHLPKNVWVRMRLLTEEMMEKKKQLDVRIRKQIAVNIEKKLAPQYKLQRTHNTLHGPLQDVSLPALFMPSRTGNVYNPRARLYFHPTGTAGELRLSQPPSIFQLPPLPEKNKASVVNLFELSKNFENPASYDWLSRIASAQMSKGSRATTAASKRSRFASPTTPAPTANNSGYDIVKQES